MWTHILCYRGLPRHVRSRPVFRIDVMKYTSVEHQSPPPQVLLPLIPPVAQMLLQKKFFPYPYGDPLRTNLLMNVLQTSDVKVTASIQPVAKLNLKI